VRRLVSFVSDDRYYRPYLLPGEELWERADFLADPEVLATDAWKTQHTSITPGYLTPDECEWFAGGAYLTSHDSLILAYCPDCFHHGFATDLLRITLPLVEGATWRPRPARHRRRIAADLTCLLPEGRQVAFAVECRRPWLELLEHGLVVALQHLAHDPA